MRHESKRVTRLELYDQVWSTPMMRLAEQYGLSDVGLAKICKKHRIPRPTRGYWARKAAGEHLKKTALPPADPDRVIEITPSNIAPPRLDGDQAARILLEKSPENKIIVPDRLSDPHPLVKHSAELLRSSEPGDLGLIEPPEDCLDIQVSKRSLPRALRVMDALIKAIELRGYEVVIGKTTCATVEGYSIPFGIRETLTTVKKEPKDLLQGDYRFGHSRFEEERVPSGQLCLTIYESGYGRWRQNWKEGASKPIEGKLNSFVAGLLTVSLKKRERELLEEERERERQERIRRQEEERKARAEKARLFKEESARVSKLMKDVEDWGKSNLIRQYVAVVESLAGAGDRPFTPPEGLEAWLKWARDQADRLDPLRPSPPSILDEPLEEEERAEEHRGARLPFYLR